MKTALSMPEDLFEELREAAAEDHVSRSRIFTEAVRDYLEKRRNQKLLSALNDAYSEDETSEEMRIRTMARRYHARRIRKEKW